MLFNIIYVDSDVVIAVVDADLVLLVVFDGDVFDTNLGQHVLLCMLNQFPRMEIPVGTTDP